MAKMNTFITNQVNQVPHYNNSAIFFILFQLSNIPKYLIYIQLIEKYKDYKRNCMVN